MYQLCNEHQNKIQRICLHPSCQSRALCLLCDHPHGSAFRSIMAKQSQSYRKFQTVINAAIDKYLLQRQESAEQKIRTEQVSLARKYFNDLRGQLQRFLEEAESQVLDKLSASQQDSFTALRRARIQKNYVQVRQDLFGMLLQVYQGMEVGDIFKNNERGNAEEAYKMMQEFHTNLISVMQARHYRHKLKLPDIMSVHFAQRQKPMDTWTNYDAQEETKKFEVKLGKQSSCEFESIISDCVSLDNYILSTSYDKKMRIFDRSLTLKGQHQYPNILTKVHGIGQDVYAVALSKELLIERIQFQKQAGLKREPIMKLSGHSQRISDLHSLNTRIIASSSTQGVKIWDLYRQRCEYTLKEKESPTAIRFLPANNVIAVGYNSHILKIYSTQSMRASRKYELKGVPLMIDQGKCPDNTFYVGAFPHNLLIFDVRMNTPSAEFDLGTDCPTCLVDSINDQSALAVGDRGGNASIVDLRTRKVRVSWVAHPAKTHLSRPRGVVALFEEGEDEWITVGCNDRSLKLWEISRVE